MAFPTSVVVQFNLASTKMTMLMSNYYNNYNVALPFTVLEKEG